MHIAGGASESGAVSYIRFPASRGRKRLAFAGGAGESWPFPLGKTNLVPCGCIFLRVVTDSLEDSLASPWPLSPVENRTR